jgi:hypothetical protein
MHRRAHDELDTTGTPSSDLVFCNFAPFNMLLRLLFAREAMFHFPLIPFGAEITLRASQGERRLGSAYPSILLGWRDCA